VYPAAPSIPILIIVKITVRLFWDQEHKDEIYDGTTEYSKNGAQCVYYAHYGDIDIGIIGYGGTHTGQFAPYTGTLHLFNI
jgi:hypothetical protein